MAIDVFREEMLVRVSHLASIRRAKGDWGRALVRTDLNAAEADFLARSFRGCIASERKAVAAAKDAAGIVRCLGRG